MKTRSALGIAVVGFAGDRLKDKKVTEFNDMGLLIPFPIQVIPPETVQSVC